MDEIVLDQQPVALALDTVDAVILLGFIAEFAEIPQDAPPDLARMAEIGARHDIEFLPSVDAAPDSQ